MLPKDNLNLPYSSHLSHFCDKIEQISTSAGDNKCFSPKKCTSRYKITVYMVRINFSYKEWVSSSPLTAATSCLPTSSALPKTIPFFSKENDSFLLSTLPQFLNDLFCTCQICYLNLFTFF